MPTNLLATRSDQENLVHQQQTAAAAKPLNQTLGKGYNGTKTPGQTKAVPKTPFKVPLNDENAPLRLGKSVLKTNGKAGESSLTVKADKTNFITPAVTRNRPALGEKTTNAKANVFITPAPNKAGLTPLKTVSPRLRRAKVKVHQPDPITHDEDDELDIELVPQSIAPLPDYPSDDEFGPDKTFPQLAPENFTRGMIGTYFNPVGDDGLTYLERQETQRRVASQKAEAEMAKKAEADLDEVESRLRRDLGMVSPAKDPAPIMRQPTPNLKPTPPGTLLSRSAAAALARDPEKHSGSPPAKTVRVPSAGMLNVRKTRQPPPPPPTMGNLPSARHAVATAASKSTLGYRQGRAASQQIRKTTTIFRDRETAGGHRRAASAASVKSGPGVAMKPLVENDDEERFQAKAADVIERIRIQDLGYIDGENEDIIDRRAAPDHDEDDEYEGFQLSIPSA